jgi:NADPH:quinone reductase-like Zn-dependent oxidoreductase
VLKPHATVVVVGGATTPLVGPLGHIAAMRLGSVRGNPKSVFFIAKPNRADMELLRKLLEAGKTRPLVEKRYELAEIAHALHFMSQGHAQGKLVVAV